MSDVFVSKWTYSNKASLSTITAWIDRFYLWNFGAALRLRQGIMYTIFFKNTTDDEKTDSVIFVLQCFLMSIFILIIIITDDKGLRHYSTIVIVKRILKDKKQFIRYIG